jgi:hypothetical protein
MTSVRGADVATDDDVQRASDPRRGRRALPFATGEAIRRPPGRRESDGG